MTVIAAPRAMLAGMAAVAQKYRLDALDTARGCAIALMILSHTVKSLLPFRKMPDFAIVPIHAITKFSAPLFILVFGLAVTVVYLPKVGTSAWPSARWSLMKRGLLVMLCYKLLCVVQMFERSPWQRIVEVLLWKRFPDFVEILQFYGWFLLLLPLLLPLWKAMPFGTKVLFTCGVGYLSHMLRESFDFWGIWQLEAILVESPKVFCFGILSRGTMVMFGLLLGELLLVGGPMARQSKLLAGVCLTLGAVCLGMFWWRFGHDVMPMLASIARNKGKHPPNLPFTLFSVGGALVLLSIFLMFDRLTAVLLKPLNIVGKESLFCFNAHIILIFVGLRYGLGLRHKVTYDQALALTAGVFGVCCFGALVYNWLKQSYRRAMRPVRQTAMDQRDPDSGPMRLRPRPPDPVVQQAVLQTAVPQARASEAAAKTVVDETSFSEHTVTMFFDPHERRRGGSPRPAHGLGRPRGGRDPKPK